MKKIEAVAATTHLDAHYERLAHEGIEYMVDSMNRSCLPMWVQHDPRIPPVGRFLAAEARPLPDGEIAVIAKGEMWEEGDVVPFLQDRTMPLGKPEHDHLFVTFDRVFREEFTPVVINELTELLGERPQEEVKKALDPLAMLQFGGTFVAGAIASGFIGAMTTDAYNALKARIKDIVRRRREARVAAQGKQETLVMFKAFVKDADGTYVLEIILTDPSDADLDWLFDKGVPELDRVLGDAIKERGRIQRVVLGVVKGKLEVKFAVRSDAVPVAIY